MGAGAGLLERALGWGTAAVGLAFVDWCYAAWHDGIVSRPEEFIDAKSDGPPRTADGHYPFADVIQHVNAEVLSHGAEMCLLRDLCQAREGRA